MRLENLYENFGKASPEQQAKYVAEYRFRRAKDMEQVAKLPRISKKKKKKKVTVAPLTKEERALMKLLNIKKKDIIAMRKL